jgi:RNA polymerase sigma-70 factor (ECF subfamily)
VDALRFVEGCIERYAEQAWRTAYVMLSNAADADDLLQQAFLVAWRKAEQAPRDNAWPWLAAIIANEARNFRRKRSRCSGPGLDSVSEPAMDNEPDKQLQRAELAALVHVCLAELGEDQRIAIVLTHLSGLSQAQAAEALGVPLNTLKARVRRGLDSLREALGKNAPGLEGTLKSLPVAPPVGGFIAAKAAWSASLASNMAVAGATTTAGATVSVNLLVAASVTVLVLVAGIAGYALQQSETPKPYVAAALPDEPAPARPKRPLKTEPEPAAVTPRPKPVPEAIAEPIPPRPEPETRTEPAPSTPREPDSRPTPPVQPPAEPEPPAGRQPGPRNLREAPSVKPDVAQVEEAIDRGCDWLKKQQGIDPEDPRPMFGKFPEELPGYAAAPPHRYLIGRTAFPVLALCSAGCFIDEKEIDTAMRWLRENYTEQGAIRTEQGSVRSTTYEDATLLLAVEAYYIGAWEAKQRKLDNPRSRLEKDAEGNKVPIKRWATIAKDDKKKKDRSFKLDKKDQKLCEIAVKALEARFRKAFGGGGWRYDRESKGESDPLVDVSATQYAILGLKAATRLGIKYDKKLLVEVFRFLRGQQDKDGPVVEATWKLTSDVDKQPEPADRAPREFKARGWAYCRESNHQPRDKTTYGSMTAAALNALILIRDELVEDQGQKKTWDKLDKDCNQMIGDGLAWMIQNWSMQENPRADMYRYYYYLCTVERLGMLGGIDEIGGHDWYSDGAELLLKQQTRDGENDGMWDIQNEIDPSDIYNTCYALLFLTRATQGVERSVPVLSGEE